MNSYQFDIGEKERAASRFIAHVRSEVQDAFLHEKTSRKLTQQQIATTLGVNRSVVNRQLGGLENMTLRSVAEMLWAMGWEPEFSAVKPVPDPGANNIEALDVDQVDKFVVPDPKPTSEEIRLVDGSYLVEAGKWLAR